MTIRVFLVDDHPMFRAGTRHAVESVDDMDVVGEAATGEEAVRTLCGGEVAADVVLMDLGLPDGPGTEAARRIIASPEPGAGAVGVPPRVLMISAREEDDAVISALRAGARGYVAKGAPREELLRAVRTVADGGAVFSPFVADRLGDYFSAVHDMPGRAAFPQLTNRERQVLDLLARGYGNRRIARELVLSDKTVRNHISHIFAKLQVTDRMAAADRARRAGLGC
ncbi:response regulator [Streptomyces sp. TRM43335]|uniref:Response regulator n=1 Tax=Streptomyces taklimakanensis TaxID=2569853 RepID=A0A6G2B8N0_9ACTN|nr:response regulator [Streptomyces taklimakanensis]